MVKTRKVEGHDANRMWARQPHIVVNKAISDLLQPIGLVGRTRDVCLLGNNVHTKDERTYSDGLHRTEPVNRCPPFPSIYLLADLTTLQHAELLFFAM